MAVQKSKKSRSRTGMKRAHSALSGPTLGVDRFSGEFHRRHHMTTEGYYLGKEIKKNSFEESEEIEETEDSTKN